MHPWNFQTCSLLHLFASQPLLQHAMHGAGGCSLAWLPRIPSTFPQCLCYHFTVKICPVPGQFEMSSEWSWGTYNGTWPFLPSLTSCPALLGPDMTTYAGSSTRICSEFSGQYCSLAQWVKSLYCQHIFALTRSVWDSGRSAETRNDGGFTWYLSSLTIIQRFEMKSAKHYARSLSRLYQERKPRVQAPRHRARALPVHEETF